MHARSAEEVVHASLYITVCTQLSHSNMASVAAASSTKDDYELVTILKLGERCSMQYTFTTSLKYQLVDDSTVVFDGYIRDCPELVRSYPALLKLYSGYTNGFLIDPKEFNCSNKVFCDDMVFVIWSP